jgi:hypothetical protein
MTHNENKRIISDLPDDAEAPSLTKFLERFTNHDHWCQWENG